MDIEVLNRLYSKECPGVVMPFFDKENPAPGLYPYIPNFLYHGCPGISKSGISLMIDNPYRYYWQYILGNRQAETQAMKIGDALHVYTLESEAAFSGRFAVSPKFDGRTKDGKAGKAAFLADNPGKIIINVEDFDLIKAMAEAVHKHPAASYLLGLDGHSEESFFWHEYDASGNQVLCKCRSDLRIPSKRVVVDLKKTAKGAGKDNFAKTISNLTYHVQAGHYLNGISTVMGESYDEFFFIAVEEAAPHMVAVYQLDQDAIELGRREAFKGIRAFSACSSSGIWPGYGDQIQPISLPRWVKETEEMIYE